ncbi:hypothetical protein KL86PLE_130272 [uncultured Pleomorphomonas sp.]|uniref:Uncharacterized protein n=1 Tax=uncultured Pleomorphomonas sp. TaxID=442121 RepID=A0A212LAI5_9HYPH|nr:hypothetical protein KL86PLE_130272 [uncultured Pleomorphomonas sp.]
MPAERNGARPSRPLAARSLRQGGRRTGHRRRGQAGRLEHRTEKWNPVFGKSDAITKN